MTTFHDLSSVQAATKKQKYERISEKKMSTPVEVLCKVSCYVCKSLIFSLRAGFHLQRNHTWSHSQSASVQVKIKTWSYKREGIWVCRNDQNRSIFFRLHFNCDACYPMKTKLSGSQPEAEEPTDHKTCLLATRWTTTPTIQCPQSTGNGAENCSLFIFFFCLYWAKKM